jgi:hypothetical protein
LYAEYTIKNQYLVSASPLLAFIRRQFLEQLFITDDESTNEVTLPKSDELPAIHTFLQDIKDKQISIRKYDSSGSLVGIQLNSVLISGTSGQFTTTSVVTPSGFPNFSPLTVGQLIRVTGTLTGTGTISQYEAKNAGSFVIGRSYKIVSVGTTDFISIGATSNAVNQVFVATGIGSGTGTAKDQEPTLANSAVYKVGSVSYVGVTPYQFVLTNVDGTALITTAGSTTGLTFSTMETNGKWSTVDPYTLQQYDLAKGPNDSIENSLVPAYHTSTQDIKDNVTPKADSITPPDNYIDDFTRGTTQDSITSVESGRDWSWNGGTFNKSVTTIDDMQPVRYPKYVDVIYMDSFYSGGTQYPDADFFTKTSTYLRSNDDSIISIESGKDWVWNGSTFNKSITSIDSTPIRGSDNLKTETINNLNDGILYYNAYNQDTSDPATSYSYELETYSEHTTRALS